jgi:hypothetical protein
MHYSERDSADGISGASFLATADDFSTVKLFNYPVVADDAPYKAFRGHASHVTSVRWVGGPGPGPGPGEGGGHGKGGGRSGGMGRVGPGGLRRPQGNKETVSEPSRVSALTLDLTRYELTRSGGVPAAHMTEGSA